MATKIYPTQQFLCLAEIVATSPHKMIKGQYADSGIPEWLDGSGLEIPAGKFIRAGSVIEAAWTRSEVARLKADGIIADASVQLNFDLESVFPEVVRFMGSGPENMVPLWQVLNSFGIHTIEEVAQNKSGKQPFTEGMSEGGVRMPVYDILLMFVEKSRADEGMEICKRTALQSKIAGQT